MEARRLLAPLISAVGAASNEAGVALAVDAARAEFGVDGAGVTIGVLSDSVSQKNGGLADSVKSGDLPPNVKILQDGPAGSSDEGRAMLENIHDLAPGANLEFATAAVGGDAGFANNIKALAASGAKVIVDDYNDGDEPFFQDGLIAQAINAVTAQGVVYITAARNSADHGYLSNFRGVDANVPALGPGRFMNFDPNGGVATQLPITVNQPNTPIVFQFDQPFKTQEPQGSPYDVTSELDFYVIDPYGRIVAAGTNNNPSTHEPVQYVYVPSPGQYTVAIKVKSGPDPGHVEFIQYGGGDNLDVSQQFGSVGGTYYPTSAGHNATQTAIGVGAVPWWATSSFLNQSPLQPEPFSASGPALIVRNPDGSPMLQPEVVQNPTVSAADGGNTSFFGISADTSHPPIAGQPATGTDLSQPGLPSFFGTSSAAPNVAAIAALLLQERPNATPAQIRAALVATAQPIDGASPGAWGPVAGYGLVNAQRALAAFAGPKVQVSPLQVWSGQPLNHAVVATFTDPLASFPAVKVAATIDWGDGQSTPSATVQPDPSVPGTYDVIGSHQYGNAGTDSLTVTVTDVGLGSGHASAPVTVRDGPISAASVPIAPVARSAFTGTIAAFQDPNPFAVAADFTSAIDWGDGTSSAGKIAQPGGPGTPFKITGEHVYAAPAAALSIDITIHARGGGTVHALGQTRVLAALTGGPASGTPAIPNTNQAGPSSSAAPGPAVDSPPSSRALTSVGPYAFLRSVVGKSSRRPRRVNHIPVRETRDASALLGPGAGLRPAHGDQRAGRAPHVPPRHRAHPSEALPGLPPARAGRAVFAAHV